MAQWTCALVLLLLALELPGDAQASDGGHVDVLTVTGVIDT